MNATIEVIFAPAEFGTLETRDLSKTVSVVFDILRATSSMVTALGNGAAAIIPVGEISQALSLRQRQPDILLAGERDGLRIEANLTGSIAFDFGNSPREFISESVAGHTIVMTTTNGTRALLACAHASRIVLGSFLNLRATSDFLAGINPAHLLLVCSGTLEQTAYEDVLGAGALCDLLCEHGQPELADSARIALQVFRAEKPDLLGAVASSRNGRRLSSRTELREDVQFCSRTDVFGFVAQTGRDGSVRRAEEF
jgi:2-phosphosulfolactate phosphatase